MPTSTHATATVRTLYIWFLTNLGGTGWLVIDFCRESPSDVAVPLIIGLTAALLSLAAVPFAIPFFALAQTVCTGWRCRLAAGAVAVLGFLAGNYLLVEMLPIGPASSLFIISRPYLAAALLAVAWMYRPRLLLAPVQHRYPYERAPL
jgi:hypothetical protein